jgi:hypothetical protein
MNKIIPILIIALLSSSAVFIFTSSDVSGATEKRTYTDALLPDVYKVDISSGGHVDVYYTDYYGSFPAEYRMYTPATAANISSYLDAGYLPDPDYVSGSGVLFVFAYRPPAELSVIIDGTQIDSNTLVLVREGVSFQFHPNQPVKIILHDTPPYGLRFGLFAPAYNANLQLENEFIIPASGDWRIFTPSYYPPMQMFLTFTVEYEERSGDTEIYGFIMLAMAAVCIGMLALSAGKRKIKG